MATDKPIDFSLIPQADRVQNLNHLDDIAAEDAAGLKKAAESYGDSWKNRGGVGAFMMLARKWDRLENALMPISTDPSLAMISKKAKTMVPAYDIFTAVEADPRGEGMLDDIRDLRRYLMLVESEIRQRGINPGHRDNK